MKEPLRLITCEITCVCGFAATITDPADFDAMEQHINRCPHWKANDSAVKKLALSAMKALLKGGQHG